ncbi:MAG TPA: response regulator [Pyrinomonadaceae bacterium]|jgi:DNA-binding NarL/FixJ family response regulator|nr:response regulator [Pyrinomonadaceae bacterium]
MDSRVILLVEDNTRDETLVLRALKKGNIINEVVVAHDGVEALDYLFGTGIYEGRDPSSTPQFVLLDLQLPKLDGLEVLRKIRADERTRRLPVIIFTSSNEEEDLISSYNLGANSFVRKPVDSEQFLRATKQLGLYWMVLNQVARVLIIDAHEVVRDGVKKILDEQPGITSFGEAGTVPDALRLVREQDWDLAVIDPHFGDRSETEVLKEIKQIRPDLPLLVFSMRSEEQFARRALKAGASGYITKDSPRSELVKAVKKVISGGRYISTNVAEEFMFDLESHSGPLHGALSEREYEVLRLIASGKTVSEIAVQLSLSDSTISTYRSRILEKMGMKTNAELTHYAIHNKLVD